VTLLTSNGFSFQFSVFGVVIFEYPIRKKHNTQNKKEEAGKVQIFGVGRAKTAEDCIPVVSSIARQHARNRESVAFGLAYFSNRPAAAMHRHATIR